MYISEIKLSNFRNFAALDLFLTGAVNIFLGRNAQGKTNILESINFSSLGRSRAAKDVELIRWEHDTALIRIKFFKSDISHEVAIELFGDKRRRRILMDGNPIKFRDLVGKLNAVMFSPEDLFMFKGSPGNRRKFLDGQIAQATPIYFVELMTYNRIVDQRNNLLKKIRENTASPAHLDLWNEQLADAAAKVIRRRLTAVKKLNNLANVAQKNISAQSENLSVEYNFHGLDSDSPNFEDLSDWYYKTLNDRIFIDIQRGTTSFGPHIDDLKFFINGKELRQFGSQGQLRTSALALKLSELQFLKDATGEYPILLLDDVMSELDADRREHLLTFLHEKKIQTLITATESAYFPVRPFGKFFEVSSGTVSEVTL